MEDVRKLISDAIDYAVETIRQNYAAQQHEREWWATYRAALSGNCAFSDPNGDGGLATEQAHIEAVAAANMAHGTLESKP